MDKNVILLNTKPWCNCHATGKWAKQDGYTLDVKANIWVHTRCRKPSEMNYRRIALGLDQIPQRPGPVDIYWQELLSDARKIIDQELMDLGWDPEDDDE